MELTVQNMYGLLIRSKLLGLEEARAMYTRWQEEARDSSTNLARFASWMVANRYVTDYQAALLARGHADGFFLGEYKVLDRLGKGQMAGVYKGQHPLGQVVAIKVLPPSKAQEPNLLSRFQREARLLLKLKHPNIVRAFQVGQAPLSSGGVLHYLVMEHLEGDTLEEVLQKRGKLPPAEAVRLVHQALQGLQHIQGHGLVHRDLKPANMMLLGAGGAWGGQSPPHAPPCESTLRATLKILDLGLGRALFDPTVNDQQMEDGLTGEGVLLGTPDYMAPEQARNARGTDIRADIYSLGCVLYHLLAGQQPFQDSNLIGLMIRHASETPRPLKDFNPAVPDGLQQIVSWMMAKDPNQRYPTPERAAQALQMFLAVGAPEVLAAPEADPKMRPYLTWLEGNAVPADVGKGDREEAPPARVSAQVRVIPPTVVTPPAAGKPPSGTIPRMARAERKELGNKQGSSGEKQALPKQAPKQEKARKSPAQEEVPSSEAANCGGVSTPPHMPPSAAPSQEDQGGFDVELVTADATGSASANAAHEDTGSQTGAACLN